MPKILFFVNRFNDIDHTVPVVWECLRRGMGVEVRSLNPFLNLGASKRLQWLKWKGARVQHLYPGCLRIPGVKRLTNWNALVGKKILDEEWHYDEMREIKPDCVVFDHAAQNGLYGVKHIRLWAIDNRVPVIDIPHGVSLYKVCPDDYIRSFEILKTACRDVLVVPHEWYRADCINHGLDGEQVKTLGSARFDPEWRQTLLKEVVQDIDPVEPRENGKLKVVLFEMGADRYHEFKETVKRAVHCIGGLPDVHIKLKPQPRNNRLHYEIPNGIEVDAKTDSVDLIRWCDMVVCLNSSIMLEAYFHGKPVIYPKYWHDEEMIFEDFNVLHTAYDVHDLIMMLTGGNYLIPKPRNEAFERAVVGEEPLKRYGDLIGRAIEDKVAA